MQKLIRIYVYIFQTAGSNLENCRCRCSSFHGVASSFRNCSVPCL